MQHPGIPDKDIDLVVLNYLKKKGYKQAEAIFKQESKLQEKGVEELAFEGLVDADLSVTKFISAFSAESRLDEAYTHLRDWVHASLDKYKGELITILYPVFIHCYLDLIAKGLVDDARDFVERHIHEHRDLHSDEITRLISVTTRQHLEENETAKKWRNNKFNVRLCRYSYNLLITYLQQSNVMSILSIINQYINIKVFTGEPEALAEKEFDAITGATAEEMDTINHKDIHWGLLEEQVVFFKDEAAAAAQPPREGEEAADGDEKMRDDSSDKEKKKAKDGPAAKKAKIEQPGSGVKTMKSLIPLPTISEQTEMRMLEDLRSRVALTASALPSICFYTFLNTDQGLNTIELTKDGSMVAAGFADSSVKIWDLKKDHARIFGDSGSAARPHKRKTDYIPLFGHSGPVYSCSFSPDNQFLLTSSEDSTARLWSMETRTNVVCYKGHNYPVWAADFSALGYYFATASHDRTARLWTTDHIFPLRIFAGHLSDVDCVKFHPNCNYVATGSSDKSVRLWEVNSGACVRIFTGHFGAVYALAFSPDGRYLASAGEDTNIIVWDLATGRKLRTFSGYHERTIWSLDFSAEGTLLASGSADETVRLWNLNAEESDGEKDQDPTKPPKKPKKSDRGSKELLKTFKTKRTPVHTVKFTGRNLLLASGAFSSD